MSGVKVTAVDLENGDTDSKEIQPGQFLVVAVKPAYVSYEQTFANGTTVMTIKQDRRHDSEPEATE